MVSSELQTRKHLGLLIEHMEDNCLAAKAGLHVNDVFVTYNEITLLSPAHLRALEENTTGASTIFVELVREAETLLVSVPSNSLGVQVRPRLSAGVLNLYEMAKQSRDCGQDRLWIQRFEEAARLAMKQQELGAANWLWMEAGRAYEKQNAWSEAYQAYLRSEQLQKEIQDKHEAYQCQTALARCCKSLNYYIQAEQHYQEALANAEGGQNEFWQASSLNDLGVLAYERGDLSSAQNYHLHALGFRERLAPGSLSVARSLTNLGNIAMESDDLAAAQQYFSQAYTIREELAPESMEMAISFHSLGFLEQKRGKLDAARDLYNRALTLLDKYDPSRTAVTLQNLGNIARENRDLVTAEDLHRRALKVRENVAPDSLEVASSLANLGLIYQDLCELERANDFHERAFAIQRRLAPEALPTAATLNNMGVIAWYRGRLAEAASYFKQAFTIQERVAPEALVTANTLNNIGLVAWSQSDFNTAKEYYQRALTIQEKIAPLTLSVALSLNNLSSVASRLGDLQTASAYGQRSLELREKIAPDSLDTAMSLANQASIHRQLGDFAKAKQMGVRAFDIRSKLAPSSLLVADSLHLLGSIHLAVEEFETSRMYHQRAVEIRRLLAPDSLDESNSLYDLGEIFMRLGIFHEALLYFERSVAILEQHRSQISSADTRAILIADQMMKYIGLIEANLAMKNFAVAFSVVERSRARSFLDMMSERQMDAVLDIPADVLKQQQLIDQQFQKTYQVLADLNSVQDTEQIETLHRQLRQLERQREELTALIRRESPHFSALQYPNPLDLEGAQAALDPDMLALVYQTDEEHTFLFALTSRSLEVFTLPMGRKALQEQIRSFRRDLDVRRIGYDLKQAVTSGRNLYQLLVEPAQKLVDAARRVLICPEGPLHALPFAALVQNKGHKPRYFGAGKPLHSALSLTVYALNKRASESREQETAKSKWISSPPSRLAAQLAVSAKRLFALGDPLYSYAGAMPAFARSGAHLEDGTDARSNQTLSLFTTELAALQTRGLTLAPLPHTRNEVEALAALFGENATVKLGAEATKTVVFAECEEADILHFACHGWLDPQIPLSSGLVLTQPESGGGLTGEDNGLLQAWEIMQKVKLKADLVVLSACQTGLGQELRGEGLIGLSRAFQYAGAQSLVVSLWEINDASTAMFMQAFYMAWKQGMSKDEALYHGIKTLQEHPRWKHPFYWSAFVLMGNPN